MKIVKGNPLDSNADAILHQVNCQGVMEGGIAEQIKDRYPVVFDMYKARCDEHEKLVKETGIDVYPLLGLAQICYKENYPVTDVKDKQAIVNLFSRNISSNNIPYTDYGALRKALEQIDIQFAGHTVAIPFEASDRKTDNWKIVSKIIDEALSKSNVIAYCYN